MTQLEILELAKNALINKIMEVSNKIIKGHNIINESTNFNEISRLRQTVKVLCKKEYELKNKLEEIDNLLFDEYAKETDPTF